MKWLRWILRPDIISDVLERVNVLHFGTHAWLNTITNKMRLTYPMISFVNLYVDHRIDKIYELQQLESELKECLY